MPPDPAHKTSWLSIRCTPGELAGWQATGSGSRPAALSSLVRRALGRVRTWTAARVDVEQARTRELARIGSNLNQLARWANTHKAGLDAVTVITHLTALSRELADVLGRRDPQGGRRCTLNFPVAGPAPAAPPPT